MNKEVISDFQGISLVILFLIGSAVVLGVGVQAKQDIWLAILLGLAMAALTLLIYVRILRIYPGKDMFDIVQHVFGPVIGKIFSLLFVWYAFHLGALVIRNFSEFMQIAALPETPQFAGVFFLGILCIWAVKEGLEVSGRVAAFITPLSLLAIVGLTLSGIPNMELNHLRPVLADGWTPVISTAYGVFTFPFAETILFTMIFSGLKNKQSIAKVFFTGLLIGGIILWITSTRNVMILGPEIAEQLVFPAYSSARQISIGEFFQRVEILVAITFTLAGLVKIGICLLAASNGLAKVMGINDYRKLAVPVGLLMMDLSLFIYKNVMEMQDWAFTVYKFYAIPFQIVLPIIIWIGAEIKVRSKKDTAFKKG